MTSTQVSLDVVEEKEAELILNPLGHSEVSNDELILPWSVDKKHLEFLKETSPTMYRNLQAVDRLHHEFSQAAEQMHWKPFAEELLPLMMSNKPHEVKEGNRIFEHIAKGLYNPLDIIDDFGNVIIRAPGARSRISSMDETNRIDLYGYLDAAYRIDSVSGGEAKTNEVLNAIDLSKDSTFDYDYLLAWDRVIVMFGFPSFFTEEERQFLGQPPIELYPGVTPVKLDYSLVPKGKVSAQGKVSTASTVAAISSVSTSDHFNDEDTEWGDD